jgi:hypothetical protein
LLEGKTNQDQLLNFKNESSTIYFITWRQSKEKYIIGLRESIVDDLIKTITLLGEKIFNFQIAHLPSIITIKSLKIKMYFF